MSEDNSLFDDAGNTCSFCGKDAPNETKVVYVLPKNNTFVVCTDCQATQAVKELKKKYAVKITRGN